MECDINESYFYTDNSTSTTHPIDMNYLNTFLNDNNNNNSESPPDSDDEEEKSRMTKEIMQIVSNYGNGTSNTNVHCYLCPKDVDHAILEENQSDLLNIPSPQEEEEEQNVEMSFSATCQINFNNFNTLFSENYNNVIEELPPDSDNEEEKSTMQIASNNSNGTSNTNVHCYSNQEDVDQTILEKSQSDLLNIPLPQKEKQQQNIKNAYTYDNSTELVKIKRHLSQSHPQRALLPSNKRTKLQQQQRRRHRECQKRYYKYSGGNKIISGLKPTAIQINEYEEFINERVICINCKEDVSVKDILIYNYEIYCMECLKKLSKEGIRIDMKYLKKDYFESKNYDREKGECKLWKCERLHHSRPISHFIVFKKGEYQFVTNCSYCRNFKAIYYAMK